MADQRLNIIFIITDQQRYDTIRALGFPYMDTPHLDRLVNDPQEVHNLWDDPATAGKKAELLDVLREWHIRSQYQTRNWSKEWR